MRRHKDIAGMTLELGRLIRKEMAKKCSCPEGPVRLQALQFLAEQPGVTMSAFAEAMQISPSTATELVDRLSRAMFVKRSFDKKNRRIVRLAITPKGMAVFAKYQKEKQKVLKAMFSTLSSADRKKLESIFSKILTHSHD